MGTEPEIAWAAGLFEGEGCATICGEQRQPRVQLTMTDEDVVRKFARVIGCGNVRRYDRRPEDRKPQWQWSVQSGPDVMRVLGALYPYLCERRQERATEVIERAAKIGEEVGFCKNGHDLSDQAHLYVHVKTGKRHCRTCRRAYQRRWMTRLGN